MVWVCHVNLESSFICIHSVAARGGGRRSSRGRGDGGGHVVVTTLLLPSLKTLLSQKNLAPSPTLTSSTPVLSSLIPFLILTLFASILSHHPNFLSLLSSILLPILPLQFSLLSFYFSLRYPFSIPPTFIFLFYHIFCNFHSFFLLPLPPLSCVLASHTCGRTQC